MNTIPNTPEKKCTHFARQKVGAFKDEKGVYKWIFKCISGCDDLEIINAWYQPSSINHTYILCESI